MFESGVVVGEHLGGRTKGHELAAGEHADGVVLQLADPGLCKWFTDQCITAGKAAGKDMSNFRSMAAAPACR